MISKLDYSRNNSNNYSSLKNLGVKNTPNFKGKEGMALKFVQSCEKQPMLNVALIDLITAIVPRTIWESLRNIFAGLEALRRESSGLIVNCLIPGFIALGIAKLANDKIMGKGKSNMADCWASADTLNNVTNHYANADKTPAFKKGMDLFNNEKHARVFAINYNLINEASGLDGSQTKKFNEILSQKEIEGKAEHLTKMMFKKNGKELTEEVTDVLPKKRLKAVFRSIAKKTHIAQDVKFGDKMVSSLDRALTDTHQIVRNMVKENIKPNETADFLNRSKKLLKVKSGVGMLIVLPLAASMQYINRKITEVTSGVKGAPIHEDFGKAEKIKKSPEQIKAEKRKLLGHKILAVGSMFGVAMLSMMKLPTKNTLKNIVQFKDRFPTMDQARAISAITFGSRMAVADDETELKEHHTRDLVTFSSMYFLGDYGAKAVATGMEKKYNIQLLNRNYDKSKNIGLLRKAKNWVVNTHLKSSDELKGVGKDLFKAKIFRANAQLANIGTSLALLGLVVPFYTISKTKKRDAIEKQKRIAEQNRTLNHIHTTKNTKFTGALIASNSTKYKSLENFKANTRTIKNENIK